MGIIVNTIKDTPLNTNTILVSTEQFHQLELKFRSTKVIQQNIE